MWCLRNFTMQSTEGEKGIDSKRGIHALCRVEIRQTITNQSPSTCACSWTQNKSHIQNPNNIPKALNRVQPAPRTYGQALKPMLPSTQSVTIRTTTVFFSSSVSLADAHPHAFPCFACRCSSACFPMFRLQMLIRMLSHSLDPKP